MRLARIQVKGIGCGSCVAPSKALFLRIPSVRSVKVYGSVIEIAYDEKLSSISDIIAESNVTEYYFVKVLSDEEEAAKEEHVLKSEKLSLQLSKE
jgi:copper chaperone CopZ